MKELCGNAARVIRIPADQRVFRRAAGMTDMRVVRNLGEKLTLPLRWPLPLPAGEGVFGEKEGGIEGYLAGFGQFLGFGVGGSAFQHGSWQVEFIL